MLPWHLTPVAMCPVFGKYTSIDRYLTNVFFCLLFSLSAKMRLHDWYKQKSEKTSPLRLFVKDRFLFMIFSFLVLWKRMTLFCELQLQSYYIRSLCQERSAAAMSMRQRCRCGSDVDACLRLGPRGWFPMHWLGLTRNCEIIHCCFCSECCSGGYSQWLYHVSLNPSVKAEHKTGLYASAVSCIEPKQYRSQPKHLAGSKIWGAKMFDFRQITLFCLGCRLSKHKITVCSDNFERHGHLGPSLATPMNTVINIGDACSANRATYPGLL